MSAKLFVLDGPAMVGKSFFSKRLLEDKELNLSFCPRVTTRAPEPGDTEYHYRTPEEFEELVNEGRFASYRVFLGGLSYGVPRRPIDEKLAAGQHALAIVDLGTGEQIKETWPDAVTIFLVSTPEEIEERLRASDDPEDVVSEKLQNAANSYSFVPYYDYVIVNRQGREEEAYSQLRELIAKLTC
jgi:guanylate kinase